MTAQDFLDAPAKGASSAEAFLDEPDTVSAEAFLDAEPAPAAAPVAASAPLPASPGPEPASGASTVNLSERLRQTGAKIRTSLAALDDTTRDVLRRGAAGIAESTAMAAGGALYAAETLKPQFSEQLAPAREFMRDVQERAKSDYGVDPARDKDFVSQVVSAASNLPVVLASGPAAPVTGAMLLGESARQDAESLGATEGQQKVTFAIGAATGALSEALLGVPALLRSARAAGATDAAVKSLARKTVEQGIKSSGREASQEFIEQVSENFAANTLVGYDPKRATTEGAGQAALLGAIVGGPVGSIVQIAAEPTGQTTPTAQSEAQPEAAPLVAEPPVTETVEPESPPIAEPAQPSQKLGATSSNKLFDWVTGNAKRLFTAEGDLPKDVFERWTQRQGEVKATSREIAYTTRDLYNGIQEAFGIPNTERFTDGFKRVSPAFVSQMNEALLGERPISTLPYQIQEPLRSMRAQIDRLSQTMLDEGIVSGELAAKVGDNMGVYMTRSYRMFDDPKWAQKIPMPVRNTARSFLLSELRSKNPAATDADAERLMQSMLQDWKEQGDQRGTGSSKLGGKDLSVFMRRKDVPKELRDLLGEYHNPVINYARSVSKMASLIGNQRFLNDVRAQGLGKFIFEDGQQPPEFSSQIAAEASEVMAPLNGLRTTPQIAAAFKEFGKVKQIDNPVFRAYMALTSIAKGAKTVGSLLTQVRNASSQIFFFGMNGHFDMRPVKKAVMGTSADIGATDSRTWRAYYKKMIELGIVDQSTKANELRDSMRDAGLNDANLDEFNERRLAKNLRKVTLDAATRAYQISDDVGKVVGFENERARQSEIHPDWSPAKVDAEAARRIRLTYPTYSMVPEWVKQFRRQPLFGPFISFAYETFRTSSHALRFTAEDLRSNNPAQRKAGMQRLTGQMAVLAGGYAVSAASRALLGMRADEEDDARRFLPPWDKNAQLLFTGKNNDGTLEYLNLSYANPYSYMTDPVMAVAVGVRNDEEILTTIAKSFGEIIRPFTSESMLSAALIDAARNKTKTGREVYNPSDDYDTKTRKVLQHVGEAIEPGTVTRLREKIIPGVMGKTTPYGQALDPVRDITAELTGFKLQKLDFRQAIGFTASRFKRDEKEAEDIFRETALRRGTVSDQEISDAWQRSDEARFSQWKNLHGATRAAQRRGVPETEVRDILKARGVPLKDVEPIVNGRYEQYQPTREVLNILKNMNRALPSIVSPHQGESLE